MTAPSHGDQACSSPALAARSIRIWPRKRADSVSRAPQGRRAWPSTALLPSSAAVAGRPAIMAGRRLPFAPIAADRGKTELGDRIDDPKPPRLFGHQAREQRFETGASAVAVGDGGGIAGDAPLLRERQRIVPRQAEPIGDEIQPGTVRGLGMDIAAERADPGIEAIACSPRSRRPAPAGNRLLRAPRADRWPAGGRSGLGRVEHAQRRQGRDAAARRSDQRDHDPQIGIANVMKRCRKDRSLPRRGCVAAVETIGAGGELSATISSC